MLFNSWEFAVFFVVVFGLYHTLALRAQNVLLLVASYFFYGCWDWRFLSLIVISTVVDFVVARRIDRVADQGHKRRLLLVSVFTNLGILGFFKYFNFFVGSAEAVLTSLGVHANVPTLHIILPVGISFYTFQTMAYTIDVYRGRMKAVDDPLNFAVYVCYFPQLVAGPIERPEHLLPQLTNKRRVTMDQLSSGALLILIGLVRKVAIADVLAGEVDRIFLTPESSPSGELLISIVFFGLQIYGDFAGYSDIARGTSRMLGIELMENFNHPYFATNITTFWRRWHISLSTWLRDYLYISLGGNRGPKWFVYRNLVLTMLLGGLWHGAGWNFVIWGGLHGVGLAVHKLWVGNRKVPDRAVVNSPATLVRAMLGWTLTMTTVGVAWIFFRASDFRTAWEVILGIMSFNGGVEPKLLAKLAVMMGLMLFIDVPQYIDRDHTVMLRWPWVVRGIVYAGLIMALLLLAPEADVAFIYFQF